MKTGRNDPCPCGSLIRFKKCCLFRPRSPRQAPPVPLMSTAAIEARLVDLGVDYARREFVEMARRLERRQAIIDEWVDCCSDVTFIREAVDELWRRLLPERPPLERLQYDIRAGYSEPVDRCGAWWEAWQALAARFPRDAQSVDDVDEWMGGPSLADWYRDFANALVEEAEIDSRWADIGVRYCRAWLAQFTEEDGEAIRHAYAHLAQRARQAA